MSEYEKLRASFASAHPPRSLFPLLWLHGDERETEEAIRAEVAAMDDGGAGGFVIESRPHNDYLGERWWRDVGFCLDEAAKRGLDVWIFDEEYYPSGIAGGKVLEGHPESRMKVLIKQSAEWREAEDWAPPAEERPMEKLLRIVCATGGSGENERVVFRTEEEFGAWREAVRKEGKPGRAWNVHRIGLTSSWSGRMFEKMVDYIDPEVTDRFISITYEETKRRLAPYWGTTIKGFFGDETSFENFASYDMLFGEKTPCFPWTRLLESSFRDAKGYDLLDWADLLWYDVDGKEDRPVRFDYMDRMTKLFSDHFFGRIQSWCHRNGVAFIGHVVEDNHAHMHHGFGVGHFFRSTKRFDMGGYDFVLRQLDSEQKRAPYEECYPQFQTYRDEPYRNFFHFTLPKLAQSAAHLELGTDLVMCENFGAYGWDLGLREMKWLTDWMTARGTNWYVPHAFSPLFPDSDCPPHFYAGGRNPQWPFFRQWADYANRSCLMLKGADHIASVAVLYPAESHWCGDRDRLDDVCRALAEHQYDFDILSCDLLADRERCKIQDGALRIGKETFRAVVLPGLETLPLEAAVRIAEFAETGGHVLEVEETAKFECGGRHAELAAALSGPAFPKRPVPIAELGRELRGKLEPGIAAGSFFPELRYCHYRHEDCDVFFLRNEGMAAVLEDAIVLPAAGNLELWHPMTGRIEEPDDYRIEEGRTVVPLRLEPYEAVFAVVRPAAPAANGSSPRTAFSAADRPSSSHRAAVAKTASAPKLEKWDVVDIRTPLDSVSVPDDLSAFGLGDWQERSELAGFSGTVVYETTLAPEQARSLPQDDSPVELNLGEVGEIAVLTLEGVHETFLPLLCPPYRWELPVSLLREGARIRVAVTNTLGSSFRDDHFRREKPAPSGLLGPVTLSAPKPPGD
ncbi:glycosyl hydrolase [Cohnella zeiphila]|uniref:Uncharacterized protein n=1 Tax=Cohnella zeiphila TaxID=2761120 RepID=A0A7X0VZQ8_9BACL|nr:glycosyl hydrolase [Cohnella zeiphila]MBB6734228.1 hypothetical protein [Cohnella zeiphila]